MAWDTDKIRQEYDRMRIDWSAKSEYLMQNMAREVVDAYDGVPHLGTEVVGNGLFVQPVHKRGGGYRNITVRLIPGMEHEEAVAIALAQIQEQWREIAA